MRDRKWFSRGPPTAAGARLVTSNCLIEEPGSRCGLAGGWRSELPPCFPSPVGVNGYVRPPRGRRGSGTSRALRVARGRRAVGRQIDPDEVARPCLKWRGLVAQGLAQGQAENQHIDQHDKAPIFAEESGT